MEGSLLLEDAESIISDLLQKEEVLITKRRWLLGLPLSKSQQKIFSKHKMLPESLVRDDDVFCEMVKTLVENARGVEGRNHDAQETKELIDISNVRKILLFCLDSLTNKALYLIAMLFTRGSASFEKTRKKMKKVIKELIPKAFDNENGIHDQQELFLQLSQLLSDPKNIRENCTALFSLHIQSHHPAAMEVLNRLEELPTNTLIAMCKKLKGFPAATPCIGKVRHGYSREALIRKARKTSMNMLSELGRGDELQAPLAKALTVAGLSLLLELGRHNSPLPDFHESTPEIKTLQGQLLNAICSIKKVPLQRLRTILSLLEPEASIPNKSFRSVVRRLLTNYLFNCNDMVTIPKSLLGALAIVNKSLQNTSSKCHLKDEIPDEVEGILSLSAELKQVALDLFPNRDFDEDFANAYMEELEGSDSEDDDSDVCYNSTDATAVAEESFGEHMPMDTQPHISTSRECCHSPQHETIKVGIEFGVENMGKGPSRIHGDGFNLNLLSPRNSSVNSNRRNGAEQRTTPDLQNPLLMNKNYNSCSNTYLGIQEICDNTSMVAYNFIGKVLEGLAHEAAVEEGEFSSETEVAGSVIAQAAEELLPSLPKSVIEKLKKLMCTHDES